MSPNKHTDLLLSDYVLNHSKVICPSGGELRYENAVVNCSIHSKDNSEVNEPVEVEKDILFL